MRIAAATLDEYLAALPTDRAAVVAEMCKVVKKNLPKGFAETMQYNMPAYVVPHKLYPAGYHCDPTQPLPFLAIAAQKNFYALYHMGIYADPKLLAWFQNEYAEQVPTKLDMGKSCIRFKNPSHIPYKLLGQLATKMTPQDWIALYERVVKH